MRMLPSSFEDRSDLQRKQCFDAEGVGGEQDQHQQQQLRSEQNPQDELRLESPQHQNLEGESELNDADEDLDDCLPKQSSMRSMRIYECQPPGLVQSTPEARPPKPERVERHVYCGEPGSTFTEVRVFETPDPLEVPWLEPPRRRLSCMLCHIQ
eukprot:NODE_4917_length_744_cov_21.018705_g4561_i0.p1 GENE.NODE_4917_length_744_cov_21.018705_g4561_i0~~NODE_4917_length_744_cov_21.018705_g4561_i0.p1  ORF type:complete len:180 (-),score=43.66 NODE_4917_length_744_cov_21.018705_g4561_i0:203-664(-)